MLILATVTSCRASDNPSAYNVLELKHGEPQFEYGSPNIVVDSLGNLFGLDGKILLGNWKVENHQISQRTKIRLEQYLTKNGLENVKVRINQYEPLDEWSRLLRNKSVGPLWRYTLGSVSLIFYTLLPQRIFGGDNYNPFTHTINLYSDHKSIALHEGGHAKDFAHRRWKGTTAFLRLIPGVALYDEYIATSDTIEYSQSFGSNRDLKKDYKILYPAYGTYVGGFLGQLTTPLIQLPIVLLGHIVGRIQASYVD